MLDAFDRGWYEDDGNHIPANTNYFVGKQQTTGGQYIDRNWFVFHVPSGPTIADARLRLFNPASVFSGYNSADATETYTLFDVSTSINTLRTGGGLPVFDDLGTGIVFGAVSVSAADNGQFVTVELNAAGLTALNARRGNDFAIAGAITTMEELINRPEHLFAGTTTTPLVGTTYLELFPEPTALLLIAPVAAVSALRRRRRTR